MKTTRTTYLVNLDSGDQLDGNPKLLRALLNKDFTRIDFGYVAPWIYDRGGWINIAPHTFLRLEGSAKRYHLHEAINIPIAPNKLDFESTEDWRAFSLVFEPIPLKSCRLDIIESEKDDKNDFNYYSIEMVLDANALIANA